MPPNLLSNAFKPPRPAPAAANGAAERAIPDIALPTVFCVLEFDKIIPRVPDEPWPESEPKVAIIRLAVSSTSEAKLATTTPR